MCKTLTGIEYTAYNAVVKIVHQALATTYKLTENTDHSINTYQHEYKQYKMNWDIRIYTDKTISGNRPEIVFQNKANQITYLIDIALPNNKYVEST